MAVGLLKMLCVCLCFQIVLCQFEESCTTVEGGIGTCVSILICAPYVTLLKQENINTATLRQLRAANCGYKGKIPHVCCPPPAPLTTPPTNSPPDTSITSSYFIAAFPKPPVCGFSNASLSEVVGRVNAKLGEFPWMALLGYHSNQGDKSHRWRCGGSLISQHHVLTSAHCILEEHLYIVRLGELDIERDDEGAAPIDILIKIMIKHEDFSPVSFINDIGLLVLEKDVEFTNLIRPICIPTRSDLRAKTFVDNNALFAGWGATKFGGPPASHLHVLKLPVQDNSFCENTSDYTAQIIDERVICWSSKTVGMGPCQGEDGGPLMQPDYNPVEFSTYFYQIGVASYGGSCGKAGFPDIYTRVIHFVPWLQKQVLGLAE